MSGSISLNAATEYGLPVDDSEQDRMDLNHYKYFLLMGDKNFIAPIGTNPQRILDIGTGTGEDDEVPRTRPNR
jgi:hypothetical protein